MSWWNLSKNSEKATPKEYGDGIALNNIKVPAGHWDDAAKFLEEQGVVELRKK